MQQDRILDLRKRGKMPDSSFIKCVPACFHNCCLLHRTCFTSSFLPSHVLDPVRVVVEAQVPEVLGGLVLEQAEVQRENRVQQGQQGRAHLAE